MYAPSASENVDKVLNTPSCAKDVLNASSSGENKDVIDEDVLNTPSGCEEVDNNDILNISDSEHDVDNIEVLNTQSVVKKKGDKVLNTPYNSHNRNDVLKMPSTGESEADEILNRSSDGEDKADDLNSPSGNKNIDEAGNNEVVNIQIGIENEADGVLNTPVDGNEDLIDDDEVLVMNFSDVDEDDNGFPNPHQTNESFDHETAIKLENHATYFEETKENILKEFNASRTEDEYILGADATADILAMARNTNIKGNELTEAQEELDSDYIVLNSDNDGNNISSNNNPIIQNTFANEDSSDGTYALHLENASQNVSSIIITNVTSIVERSENISLSQIEECGTNKNVIRPDSNLVFKNKNLQINHVSKDSSVSNQIFNCEICPFSSKTRFSLSRHKLLHVNITSNQESISENNTIYQSEPDDSEIPKINIFKCTFCSFESKIRFALQRHVLIHTDNKIKTNCLANRNNSVILHGRTLPNSGLTKKTKFLNARNNSESLNTPKAKCKYCSFVAKNHVGLGNHVRFAHKNKITVKCPSCCKIIRKQKMQEHKLICIKINKHGVKTGHSTSTLIKIVRGTNKKNNVIFSEKIMKPENSFNPNDLKTPQNNIFKCTFCSFESKIRFALHRHVLIHTDNKIKTNCLANRNNTVVLHDRTLPNSGLTKKTKFLNAQNNSESLNTPKAKCKYCSFVAKNQVGLVNHVRFAHENKITVKCPSCRKIIRKQKMQEHKLLCIKINKHGVKTGHSTSTLIKIVRDTNKKNNVIFSEKIMKPENSFNPNDFKTPQNSIFKCTICSFVSKIRFALQRHVLSHTNSLTETKCLFDQIDTVAPRSDILPLSDFIKESECLTNQNITESSNTRKNKCKYCSFEARNPIELFNHVKLAHKNKIPVKCPSCHKIIRKNIQEHKLSCIKINRLDIKAGRSTSTSIKIVKEANEGTNVMFPKKIMKSENSFKRDLRATTKMRNTVCTSIQSSTSHKYQCDYCSYSGNFIAPMTKHILLHTKYHRPIYSCTKCKYKSTKWALARHVSTHRGVKYLDPFKKQEGELENLKAGSKKCVKGEDTVPATKTILRETETPQIKKDTKIPQLNKDESGEASTVSTMQCKYCSHISQNSRNFKIHLLMHTKGNTPVYQCTECSYISTKISLTKHINTVHRGTRFEIINNASMLMKRTENNQKQKRVSKRLVQLSVDANSNEALSEYSFIKGKVATLVEKSSKCNDVGNLQSLKEGTFSLSDERSTITGSDLNDILYVCEICGFEIDRKETLIIHKLTHSNVTTSDENKNKCLDAKDLTKNIEPFAKSLRPKSEQSISRKNIRKCSNNEQERKCVSLKNGEKHCSVCKRSFLKACAFSKHTCLNLFYKSVEREGNKFTCRECLFSSFSWIRVKTHLLVHKTFEEAAAHKCLICNFRTKYKSSLNYHQLRVHGRVPSQKSLNYSCGICNYKTNHRGLIRKHTISCNKKTVSSAKTSNKIKYKCDNCDFQTSHKDNLQNHKILHININELRVYENQTYNVKINKNSSKKSGNHGKACNGSKQGETNVSTETSADELPKQENTDKGSKLLSCNFCSFRTKNRTSLSNHRYISNCPGKIYKCNRCSFKATRPQYLTNHKKIHETSQIYSCDCCNYSSHVKANLHKHKQNHHFNTTKKRSTNLKTNSRISSTSKDLGESTKSGIEFRCRHCKYKTKFRFQLKRHFEKRHMKKKIPCKYVKLSKDKTVTNATIFKCKVCPFTSKYTGNFKRHVQNRHSEKVTKKRIFRCSSCSFGTNYKHSLLRHVEALHVENRDDGKSEELCKDSKVNKESVFKCSSCFYTTKHKHNLDRHFNMCHVEK